THLHLRPPTPPPPPYTTLFRSEQAEHVRRTERLARERDRHRAVDAARDTHDRAAQPRLGGLVTDEQNEHLPHERLVDPQRRRIKIGRATSELQSPDHLVCRLLL